MSSLRQGGYVLLMRHAASPAARPDAAAADPKNTGLERQLDRAGRESAAAMGAAFRSLRLPIGEVFTSPTFRARQTLELAGFPSFSTQVPLGDGGQNMALPAETSAQWLRSALAKAPRQGTNTLLATHQPNIAAATDIRDAKDGEVLVFKPDLRGGTELVGRIGIEEWPRLAGAR